MKKKYKAVRFMPRTLRLIEKIDDIVKDYQRQGYEITLRQLYYQLVSKNIIANKKREYKRLGKIVGKARIGGLLDWAAIEDRTRELSQFTHWDSPAERVRVAANSYHLDTRLTQPRYIEVWIEKQSLFSIVERVCDEHDVPIFVCRGYPSITAKHDATKRLLQYEHRNPVILYLGDHDPSGLDIPRELRESFDLFGAFFVEIRRIALTMAQIEEYALPPNPAKITDSRAKNYIRIYGQKSWELDALRPDVLSKIINDEIDALTDHAKLAVRREIQLLHRSELRKIADRYNYGDDDDVLF